MAAKLMIHAELDRAERLEIQVAITEALSSAANAQAILAALRPILLRTGASHANLLYIDCDVEGNPEYAESVARVSSTGSPQPLNAIGITRFRIADFPYVATGLAQNTPIYMIEDIFTDARVDESMRQMARWSDFAAIITLALRIGRNWQGFLSVNYGSARHFDEETRLLFNELLPTIAAVVGRHRAYLAQEAAQRESDLLYRMSRSVSAATTYQELLEAIALNAPLHTYSTSFSVYEGQGLLRVMASYGRLPIPIGVHVPSPPNKHPFPQDELWMVTSLEDLRLGTEGIGYMRRMGVEAYISLPLRVGNSIIGRFTFAHDAPRQYSASELRIARGISEVASVALERIRLHNEREASRHRAEILTTISAALSAAEDEAAILEAIGLYADGQGPDEITLAYLEEFEADHAPTWAAKTAIRRHGQPVVAIPIGHRYPLDHYTLAGTWRTPPGYPIFVGDTATDPRFRDDQKAALLQTNHAAFVFIPLYSRGAWQGIITVSWAHPRYFGPDDHFLYPQMAQIAAAIVANRRLYLREFDAAERLRRLDRVKDDFISNMSHELRTPLNAIIGLSDVILSDMDGPIGPKVRADVGTIYHAGQQLLNIVNDILDLTKIRSGTLSIIFLPTQIGPLLEEVATTGRYLAEVKGLTLRVNLPAKAPNIEMDAARIRQALLNLIANAVKYSDKGTIDLSAVVGKDGVTISVHDEGVGIEPAYHEAIFQPFWQAESNRIQQKGGVGLGLSITRQLVLLHHGRIWVESTPGVGSCFCIWLPLTQTTTL